MFSYKQLIIRHSNCRSHENDGLRECCCVYLRRADTIAMHLYSPSSFLALPPGKYFSTGVFLWKGEFVRVIESCGAPVCECTPSSEQLRRIFLHYPSNQPAPEVYGIELAGLGDVQDTMPTFSITSIL